MLSRVLWKSQRCRSRHPGTRGTPETTMNKRILVGVDMDLSPPTRQALYVVSEFLELPASSLHVFLSEGVSTGA
jgi:hypothetical protein